MAATVSKCKGVLIKVDIATVFTTIAQLLSVKPPKIKSEDFESKTLDQAGTFTPRELTGYNEADSWDAELFWSPDEAPHAKIWDNIVTPAKTNFKIVFVNAAASEIAFTSAGMEAGPEVNMSNGLKIKVGGNVDGAAVLTV